MRFYNMSGLVVQNGPSKPSINRPNILWSGGGVAAGGTKHAGNGNWKQVMNPRQSSRDTGFPKPSSYAIPSIVYKKLKEPTQKIKKEKVNYLKQIATTLLEQKELTMKIAGVGAPIPPNLNNPLQQRFNRRSGGFGPGGFGPGGFAPGGAPGGFGPGTGGTVEDEAMAPGPSHQRTVTSETLVQEPTGAFRLAPAESVPTLPGSFIQDVIMEEAPETTINIPGSFIQDVIMEDAPEPTINIPQQKGLNFKSEEIFSDPVSNIVLKRRTSEIPDTKKPATILEETYSALAEKQTKKPEKPKFRKKRAEVVAKKTYVKAEKPSKFQQKRRAEVVAKEPYVEPEEHKNLKRKAPTYKWSSLEKKPKFTIEQKPKAASDSLKIITTNLPKRSLGRKYQQTQAKTFMEEITNIENRKKSLRPRKK